MRKKLKKYPKRLTKHTVQLAQVVQKDDSHCGPAVIQALLAHLQKPVTQDQVVEAARVRGRIMRHGTRPDQLARGVEKLTPEFQFWFKQHASIQDLTDLVHKYHWPVAINWQGLFYDSCEEEDEEDPNGDHGHYSIVIDIHPEKGQIMIADPYHEYSKVPRVFSLDWFEKRWWDVDDVRDPKTKQHDKIETDRLLFVIVPKGVDFPIKLGMQLPDKLDVLKQNQRFGFLSKLWRG